MQDIFSGFNFLCLGFGFSNCTRQPYFTLLPFDLSVPSGVSHPTFSLSLLTKVQIASPLIFCQYKCSKKTNSDAISSTRLRQWPHRVNKPLFDFLFLRFCYTIHFSFFILLATDVGNRYITAYSTINCKKYWKNCAS